MEAESRRINRVFSMEPLTVYTQWKGNTMTIKTAMRRLETEQYDKKSGITQHRCQKGWKTEEQATTNSQRTNLLPSEGLPSQGCNPI